MKGFFHVSKIYLVIILLCCAGAAGQTEDVTLRLWNVPLKGTTHPPSVARRRVFEAFCRKYPNIKVKALVPLKIEGPASEGNEFMAVAGGVAPDVFYLYGRKIGDYYNQGFLAPLDSYLAGFQKTTGKPYAGINAPSSVWELCQIDNKIYGVPYLYYSMALMCRSDLFARAGLPLKPPRDWDDLYRIARRLTWSPDREPGAHPEDTTIFGLRMLTGLHGGWHLLQHFWSSGGEVVRSYYPLSEGKEVQVPAPPVEYRKWHINISNADRYYSQLDLLRKKLVGMGVNPDYSMKDLKWRLDIDNPEGVAVLEFYRRLIHTRWLRCENHHPDREFDLTPDMLKTCKAECPVCRRIVDLSRPEGHKRIYTGVVLESDNEASQARNLRYEYAMLIGTVDEVQQTSEATSWVALPFPSRTANILPAAFIAGHYLGMNATQKDLRVRDAAWKYIEFVTGPEAQRIQVETYVDYGLAQFIRPTNLKALGYDLELKRIPPERRALWDLLDKYAKVEPYCRGFQHVQTRELGIPLQGISGDRPDELGRFNRDPKAMLAQVCRRVNTMILGEMPKEILQRRTKIGWFVGGAVLLFLGAGTYGTIRLAMRIHQKAADLEGFGVRGKTVRRTLAVIIFLAPAVCSVLLWSYYPLIRGTLMAFQEYKILGGSKFVGLKNFVETVSAPEFWRYLLQTFEYLVLNLSMGFLAPIALAIFLTEIPKGKILFRTIYYLPAVTTGIVTLFMWKQLLYDRSSSGLINSMLLYFNDLSPGMMILLKGLIVCALVGVILGLISLGMNRGAALWGRIACLAFAAVGLVYIVWRILGICEGRSLMALVRWFTLAWQMKPQEFLQDPNLAMVWIIIPTIWAGIGPGCLIYLAALKGIPDEQYEAADLDGAGIWAKITQVVVPNLSALILINFVGAVVGAMQSSSNIFVMTGGGPEDVTMTVGLSIWFNAYMYLNFGLATAQAWILGALLVGFTLYQLRVLNQMQFRTTSAGR
jgi:ABC-type sugar transport system permease subunit/ABC-type glycerol-3-phosphate transport system substrate-binding protein